ncbi:g8879 [Coccomyxa elongata]
MRAHALNCKHSDLCHKWLLQSKGAHPSRILSSTRSIVSRQRTSNHFTQQSSVLRAMSSAPSAQSLGQMTPTDGAHLQAASERIPSVRAGIATGFGTALQKAFPSVDIQPAVAATNNPDHGDYQCNNAMALFGRMKGKEGAPKNPREVATAILNALPDMPAIDGKPTLAGPGFINIKLSSQWLSSRIQDMIKQGAGSWAPSLPYKRALVDFSSPNVAKEMHVGHLRSTIIGDTIARTLEFCGVDTLRINHVGDWGTQFGMLIQHIAETRPGGLHGTTTEDVSDLQALYKASKQRFDAEEDFKARAREAVTRLQSGDPEFEETWKRICEASRNEFDAIYQRLDVRLVWRGESFYNPRLTPLVEELIERGIAEESEGAMVIHVEGQKTPLMIRKSDGGYGYGTTDMAALYQRIHEEKGEWLIYVTDEGQAGHFKLVFGAGKRAGIIPANNPPRIDHVGFGLVLGQDGKRIRTRDSGAAVRLVELLDEAKERCAASVRERQETTIERGGEEISAEELDNISSVMGYGAVKYADLKNNRSTNYKFNFDEMLDLKGNTAVYMLYAHARIAGIIRKGKKDVNEVAQKAQMSLDHPSERALALHIVRFTEMLEDTLVDLAPNRITEYVYEMSNYFNTFYQACKVLGEAEEDSRLLLCEATAMIMRQCFQLLGIKPLYRI